MADPAATVAWTTVALVCDALNDARPAADPYLASVVGAANAWCLRKRREAGYVDDDTPGAGAPSWDVQVGATLYAVALWRERASTDGYPSFEDLATFTPTGGSLGQIRRLLGIGRAAVDRVDEATVVAARRRRMLGRRWA